MRTEQKALDVIANVMVGQPWDGGYYEGGTDISITVPQDTETDLATMNATDVPAGRYTVTVSAEWFYSTTRDSMDFVFYDKTDTEILRLSRDSADAHQISMMTVAKPFTHAGGEMGLRMTGYHNRAQTATVESAWIMVQRVG
jgi:hypothetical protein